MMPCYSNEHTWIHHLVTSIFFIFIHIPHLDIIIDVEDFMCWGLLLFLKILCCDGVTEIVESLDTINETHIIYLEDLKGHESRSLNKHEKITYPLLAHQIEESHRNLVIVPVTKADGMFPTNNKVLTTDLIIATNEKHKESNRSQDANERTEEDVVLSIAAWEAKGLEHERNMD